jgi:hypothetical protein
MLPGLNAIFESMTRENPLERCKVRDAFERFSQLRGTLSDEQLAGSPPRTVAQSLPEKEFERLVNIEGGLANEGSTLLNI